MAIPLERLPIPREPDYGECTATFLLMIHCCEYVIEKVPLPDNLEIPGGVSFPVPNYSLHALFGIDDD